MKKDLQSRRMFVGALAMGATASTIAAMTNPLGALAMGESTPDIPLDNPGDAESWFKKVKGSRRVVFDGSMPHAGFPIIWNWAFYLTNNQSGSADSDITAMSVLRHDAIPFALESGLWEKYKFGETYGITDNISGQPALRNPYYEPREGDFPAPAIEGIKRLQERGALFCVCNLAILVYSGMAAQKMNLDPTEVYQEWVDGILPGIQLVPSGVWALERAQKTGCSYIYAGG